MRHVPRARWKWLRGRKDHERSRPSFTGSSEAAQCTTCPNHFRWEGRNALVQEFAQRGSDSLAGVLHSLAASKEIAWTLYAAVAATANGFHFFTCEMLEKEVCHGSQEKSTRPRGFAPSVSRAGSKN